MLKVMGRVDAETISANPTFARWDDQIRDEAMLCDEQIGREKLYTLRTPFDHSRPSRPPMSSVRCCCTQTSDIVADSGVRPLLVVSIDDLQEDVSFELCVGDPLTRVGVQVDVLSRALRAPLGSAGRLLQPLVPRCKLVAFSQSCFPDWRMPDWHGHGSRSCSPWWLWLTGCLLVLDVRGWEFMV